jgi:hypothetical protein
MTWLTLIELPGASINTEVHVVSLTIGVGVAASYELLSTQNRTFNGAKRKLDSLEFARSLRFAYLNQQLLTD